MTKPKKLMGNTESRLTQWAAWNGTGSVDLGPFFPSEVSTNYGGHRSTCDKLAKDGYRFVVKDSWGEVCEEIPLNGTITVVAVPT